MIRSKKKHIGLFGGSFDPVHKGHLKISNISIKKLRLNKLYWVITKKNPFKHKTFFSLNERIKRCKNIVKKNRKIKIQSLDKIIKSSRTINIIKYLMKKNRNTIFYLIIGSDNLIDFHKWASWKKILKLSKLVVFSRKGYNKKAEKSAIIKYLNKNNIIYIKNFNEPYSSSQIRKKYLN